MDLLLFAFPGAGVPESFGEGVIVDFQLGYLQIIRIFILIKL